MQNGLSIPYPNYPTWVSSRILANAIPDSVTGCIEYGGGKLKHKYGLISITLTGHRMSVPAHRALWMAVHKDFSLPSKVYVRHKCDNPRCVNIDHLEIGTPKGNVKDGIEREHRAKKYKPHTRQCIFTDDQIRQIRAASGKLKWIAEEFNTTTGYVSKLKNRKAKNLVI